MVNSHTQDFVQDSALKLLPKGAFQRSTRNSAMGDNVVHRQVSSGKVSLDVSQGIADARVLKSKNFCAFPSRDSFWRDPPMNLWWRFAIYEAVK
jgi:hypothetical protein